MDTERQRIDKWLWHARVVRTRTAAAALAKGGHVRVNSERVTAASQPVRPGDVVTIALDRTVRVIRVIGFGERRGSPEAAATLYQDMTAPPDGPEPPAQRSAGGGRPTKRERRSLDRLKPNWEQ